MYAAIIILIYSVMIIFELIPLIKNKEKIKVISYSILAIMSLILSILLSLDIKIPSPAYVIEKIVFAIIKK